MKVVNDNECGWINDLNRRTDIKTLKILFAIVSMREILNDEKNSNIHGNFITGYVCNNFLRPAVYHEKRKH